MAYLRDGLASDYRDLLRKTVRFLTGRGGMGTPVYTGTGNGTLVDLDTSANPPAETWTIECSNATKTGAANYGATVAAQNPVVHWRFGEAAGVNIAQDNTANNIDGFIAGPVAASYFRILVSANNGYTQGGNYVVWISEIEFRDAVGGVDLTTGGSAISSSEYTSAYLDDYAFNNTNATQWASASNVQMPQWIGYHFAAPVTVREVVITASTTPTSAPRDFVLQLSDDGVLWRTVTAIANQTGWSGNQTRAFAVSESSVQVNVPGLLSVDTNKSFLFVAGNVASAANSLLQITGNVALECVIRPTSISGTQFIAGVGAPPGGNATNRLIALWAVDGYLRIEHQYGNNISQYRTTGFKLDANRTYHVVLSRDVASKTYSLYVGGLLVYTYYYVFQTSDGGSSYLIVGDRPEGSTSFFGYIDEVALYPASMDATTARAHAVAALGEETFTVTGSVSGARANAIAGLPYADLLEFEIIPGTIDFIVGDDWTVAVTANALGAQAWTLNRFDESLVFLQGHGLAGTDEIFVSIRTYFDANLDIYNWEIRQADGYDATLDESGQPNVSPPKYMPAWNAATPFWIRASGRFFWLVAKISTTYQMCNAGFFLPAALTSEWKRPAIVGGSVRLATQRYSQTGDDGRAFFSPGFNSLCLRRPDGAWIEFNNWESSNNAQTALVTWPYIHVVTSATNTAQFKNIRDTITGKMPLFPVWLMGHNRLTNTFIGALGFLDGCKAVTGFNNASENVVNLDGVEHVVFQNTYRTGYGDYCAMELM